MKGEKSNIVIIVVLFLVAMYFSACRPKGILHSWEMREVLVDLHKTDALLQISGKQYCKDEDKGIYYAVVLEKHGITQAEFDSSLVWYTAHPQLFDKIYPRVLAQLKAEEEQFLRDNANEPEVLKPSITVKPKPISHAQLDSIVQTTLYGYPYHWSDRPLMQDSVNQLLPQVGVLR